nr:helix-turn-helix transcriptional regulator [uncultured Allomuricauda sp.]
MNTEEFLELYDSSGLSKVDLALALDMSRTSVYNWLGGGNIPKKNWKRIRDVLSKSPEELKDLVAKNLQKQMNDYQDSPDQPNTIRLDLNLLDSKQDTGRLLLFLNKNLNELKEDVAFGLFFEKIENAAVNKFKNALVEDADQESFTKEEYIKKVLSKTITKVK